jgi:hypothetical protein
VAGQHCSPPGSAARWHPMRRRASSPLLGLAGIVLLPALLLTPSGCSKPVQMGQAPNIVIPIERKPPPGDAPPPASREPEPPPAVHQAPDPAPNRSAAQVDLMLRFEGGRLHLLGSQRVTLEIAEATPRRMGRFAAELWLGTELIERLRFDVPLLAADGGEALEAGLATDVTIRLPLLERANRLEIVDRKTEEKLTLEWPPS